jgi:hypothetical protein
MPNNNIALIEEISRMAPAVAGKTFISVDVNRWVVTVPHPDDASVTIQTTDGNMTAALMSMVDRLKAVGVE